ncbi:lipoyl(octanoyl) transferase LipB [Chelativorans sp. ZYF759]|uniref:lipoyl(octanoyl) transferase LipB n=1 Tax=Chelativorans sp. ZYF759 TaxID=2692213 RepID=UPI00145DC19A|nr:lipoyl(octanoyl) transferase LipB [Chelativorans sp. ZYF759]NMG38603.1 lipoyl(octanoyl) transferase LipB [Chelativorans sp. ZYF759]
MNIRPQTGTILFPRDDAAAVAFARAAGLTAYPEALALMEARARAIAEGDAGELVWLVEHPPLYTAGTSARQSDLVEPGRFPVFDAGRGGQYTYHGPGQRVAYLMLDLKRRRQDVRAFVQALEEWIIRALARHDIAGERRETGVGVWVERPDGPGAEKIAAIGIRLRRWVSFHGIAINVRPDLSHFAGIVPCGIPGAGVTSLAERGVDLSLAEFDRSLKAAFEEVFGPATPIEEA